MNEYHLNFCLMEYTASVRVTQSVTRTGNHNLIWLATAGQRPQPGAPGCLRCG